jgi:ubiquinone/menaquinone biosynthesis C-methylase UbiE/tetratricopeptide (TPR) repeat protein
LNVGRNAPCPCGSGRKHKHCCGRPDAGAGGPAAAPAAPLQHDNRAAALHAEGLLEDAIAEYRAALALAPDLVVAHNNLGNALGALGRLDDAAASYVRALARAPDHVESHFNLGYVRHLQGRLPEAVACYERVAALRPQLAAVHNNLGNALSDLGHAERALASYRRAFALEDTPEIRANLGRCLTAVAVRPDDPPLGALLARALDEAWTRPADLARVAAQWVVADAGTERDGAIAARRLATYPLLRALLRSAPVADVVLERLLTSVRRAMLERVDDKWDEPTLQFHAALAEQCFIGEYVWACSDEEATRGAAVRDAIERDAAAHRPVPPQHLVAVAAYFGLATLRCIQELRTRTWPACVHTLLVQQVDAPAEEAMLRDRLPVLTPLNDAVSTRVRAQYEDNPYPRWVRLPPPSGPSSVHAELRARYPRASAAAMSTDSKERVLIAGCGTGQETVDLARRLTHAHILGVDLSRASLAYAQRKSREAGVSNVEYAQADLLELPQLDRTFDVVSAVGVLHHLAEPAAGLRALTAVLRPGGFMRLGLYSAAAREDVVAARRFIAEQGFAPTPAGIRTARQALIEAGAPFESITARRDFHSTSECRDLLFHVQEHRLSLEQIAEMLDGNGLRFLGFLLEPNVLLRYRERFPGDATATDLASWAAFERDEPRTFVGMYRFWVQKAGA